MTFEQWQKTTNANYSKHGDLLIVEIPNKVDSTFYDLWHLDDFVVTSSNGPVVHLLPTPKEPFPRRRFKMEPTIGDQMIYPEGYPDDFIP